MRPIDPTSDDEIATVAARMRRTLVEVLGDRRGEAMYTLEWLDDRVRWHLDPSSVTGAVLVAEEAGTGLSGHVILRAEDDDGRRFGLFSTMYVVPERRRSGAASALLTAGEAWMRALGLADAATYTHPGNAGLIALYRRHGYRLEPIDDDFVRLTRDLAHVVGGPTIADAAPRGTPTDRLTDTARPEHTR